MIANLIHGNIVFYQSFYSWSIRCNFVCKTADTLLAQSLSAHGKVIPILSVLNPKFFYPIFCSVNASGELKSVGPRPKI